MMSNLGVLSDILEPFENMVLSESSRIWVSEPYGDLELVVTLKVENEIIDGSYFINKSINSKNGTVKNSSAALYRVENIKNYTYDDIPLSEDYSGNKSDKIHSSFFVPLDCEYMMNGNEKIIPVDGEIETPDGTLVQFKICFCTFSANENENFIFYDKEGNTHKINRR